MARKNMSVRLEDELRRRLAEMADRQGTTVTSLVERYVSEGMATEGHPGIVFKDGPSGRRAALAGGPDVWEVIAALRQVPTQQSRRLSWVAEQFGIHERQVAIALDYAAANRAEIETRIDDNERALERAERLAREREQLLG